MELFLTSPVRRDAGLARVYKKAFREATELYLVSAYLTTWQAPNLNRACKSFTFIIGKDFGITRKNACQDVLGWLPEQFLSDFLVADGIAGFHPKALFWRDGRGRYHMLVGSSNMTEAAMSGNVEANLYRDIARDEFEAARRWVGELAKNSVPVNGLSIAHKVALFSQNSAARPRHEEKAGHNQNGLLALPTSQRTRQGAGRHAEETTNRGRRDTSPYGGRHAVGGMGA